MAYLQCPRCGTTVEERPGMQMVCPKCGFSGDVPGQPQPSGHGQPSGYAAASGGPTAGAYSASPYGAQGGTGGYLPPAAPVPQPAPQAQHGQYAQYAQAQPTNGMAITALVMGIIGLFFQITAPLAIVFGIIGRKQCKERGEKGEGMALAGIVLGSVVVAIVLLFVLFFFALWGSLFYSL